MKLKFKIAICFCILALLAMACQLFAGGHVQRIVTSSYGYQCNYAQPIYLNQLYSPYYYSVGSDLILDSLAERLSQRIEQKLVERQRKAEAAAMPKPQQSIAAQNCAKCHSPNAKAVKESEAPIFFDAGGAMTANAEQRASMRTAAKLGSMPPPPAQPLTDDAYLELKQELERHADVRQPPPPPKPESE